MFAKIKAHNFHDIQYQSHAWIHVHVHVDTCLDLHINTLQVKTETAIDIFNLMFVNHCIKCLLQPTINKLKSVVFFIYTDASLQNPLFKTTNKLKN